MSGSDALLEVTAEEVSQHLLEVAQSSRIAREAWSSMDTPMELFGKRDWNLDLDPGPCPDRMPGPDDEIDAILVKARGDGLGRVRESRRQRFTSRKDLEAHMASFPKRVRESWGYDRFASGWEGQGGGWSGVRDQYVPLMPGPVTRQLYWADYFAMSAKAFEAYNHDPITWRAVQLQQEFVIGKDVHVRAKYSRGPKIGQTHEDAQAAWDDFDKRNKLSDWRLAAIVRDVCTLGEQFIRYFPVPGKPKQLVVRSVDPASIYDIITDPEDFETVYAYHQQFQTPYQLYAPQRATPGAGMASSPTGPSTPGQITKYVIRQILPQEIDHYRMNVGNMERRGRSDLFPSLSWIQRLRVYLTSKVVRSDMLARLTWDLTVDGNAADIGLTRAKLFPFGQAPPPGTVFAHSSSSKLEAVDPGADTMGSAVDPTFIALANMVCLGPGVPVDYLLQVMRGGTRANALVATEPVSKRFDDRQGWVRTFMSDAGDRVFARASITDAELEITFPPIATENAQQGLQDLNFAEANSWLSKKTAGERAATILGVKGYDFEQEQGLIAAEFEDPDMMDEPNGLLDAMGNPAQVAKPGTGKRSVIIATNRQAAKLDPSKVSAGDDEPPGVLVPYAGQTVPPGGGSPGPGSPLTGQPGQPRVPGRPQPAPASAATRGGVPATENPAGGAGAASIRSTGGRVRAAEGDELAEVLGELRDVLARMREARTRPDDPEFLAAAETYRARSAGNMAQLVRDSETGEPL